LSGLLLLKFGDYFFNALYEVLRDEQAHTPDAQQPNQDIDNKSLD
jgi:hypothetical protein